MCLIVDSVNTVPNPCPVCKTTADVYPTSGHWYVVECDPCGGMYKISSTAVACIHTASDARRRQITAAGGKWLKRQPRETKVGRKMPYLSVLNNCIVFTRTEAPDKILFSIPLEQSVFF